MSVLMLFYNAEYRLLLLPQIFKIMLFVQVLRVTLAHYIIDLFLIQFGKHINLHVGLVEDCIVFDELKETLERDRRGKHCIKI